MFKGKAACQIIAQRLYAIALGGMVPRRDKADGVLSRAVESLFGGFAAQVQIHTGFHRATDRALPASRAPTDTADHVTAFDQQRLAPKHILHASGKIPRA